MTTVAEAAAALEKARADLAQAKEELALAEANEKACAERERAAYRTFNEAVAAVRPKRNPRPKKENEEATADA